MNAEDTRAGIYDRSKSEPYEVEPHRAISMEGVVVQWISTFRWTKMPSKSYITAAWRLWTD